MSFRQSFFEFVAWLINFHNNIDGKWSQKVLVLSNFSQKDSQMAAVKPYLCPLTEQCVFLPDLVRNARKSAAKPLNTTKLIFNVQQQTQTRERACTATILFLCTTCPGARVPLSHTRYICDQRTDNLDFSVAKICRSLSHMFSTKTHIDTRGSSKETAAVGSHELNFCSKFGTIFVH